MTPPVRSQPVVRPSAETPQPRQPWPPHPSAANLPAATCLALEHALSITTASSEDDLLARTVEAAGRLTEATVACAVPSTGNPYTWGDPEPAAGLVAELADPRPRTAEPYSGHPPERLALAHLGLPDALAARIGFVPLVVASTEPDQFSTEAQRVFALVIAHAAAGRERLREVALLARRADCDPLTGLRHYRPFEERLAASLPGRTAVVAIDVDNFKQINDRHGHQAGDSALVTLVRALSRALRGDDHIYRIGGDEFAVVIDVATAAEVTAISRRLLLAARGAGYPISVGAALCSPQETGRETLLRADRALYQAKRAGRNTARLAA